MTRFARADGSKASNKRIVEEATSWQSMKADLKLIKKDLKKKKKGISKPKQKNLLNENKDLLINQVENGNPTTFKTVDEVKFTTVTTKKQKKVKKKDTLDAFKLSGFTSQNKDTSLTETKKEKKRNLSLEERKNKHVVEDGLKYKVFKSGKKKPWFDLSYEENEIMTKYKHFFIKREDVAALNELRNSLEAQNVDEKQIVNKLLNKERKAHNKLRVEQLRRHIKKNKENEESSSQKTTTEKSTELIPDKKETTEVEESDPNLGEKQKKENENSSTSPEKRKKKNRKSLSPNNESKEMKNPDPSVEKKERKENIDLSISPKKTKSLIHPQNEGREVEDSIPSIEKDNLEFEENEVMTQYNGYWILKENIAHIELVGTNKKESMIKERKDGNDDTNLTEEEELQYRRFMKKEKRKQTELLRRKLRKINKKRSGPSSEPKQSSWKDKETSANFTPYFIPKQNREFVKFDGYNVKKDGAQRLMFLKNQMISKGCSGEEISDVLKTERRKEEKVYKSEMRTFCYKCRSVGHRVSFCPMNVQEGNDKGVEICYKCGSSEHMARNCRSVKGDTFSHATCFICGEVGHISRECPDNPRGLYPNGGCCNECGSVEHLRRDCPDLRKHFEQSTIKLPVFKSDQEIDSLDLPPGEESRDSQIRKKPKIVVFDD